MCRVAETEEHPIEAVSVALDTRPGMAFPDQKESIIIPLGDIQLGPRLKKAERAAHLGRLRRVVQWGIDHDAYFVGMGDMSDVASPSNRAALRAVRLYDTVYDTLEEGARATQEELEEELAGTVGRWLGLAQGHHYWDYDDGTTTDTRLADFLGCRFLGDTGYIVARQTAESGRQVLSKFWVWHGEGSGASIASPLTKLERKVGDHDADVYLMGHYHRAMSAKKPRLGVTGGDRGGEPRIVHRDKLLVATGSFMRGYQQGSRRSGRAGGSYVEKSGMSPAALGVRVVFVRPLDDGGLELDDMSL